LTIACRDRAASQKLLSNTYPDRAASQKLLSQHTIEVNYWDYGLWRH
jgi:hypothetical protein